MFIIAIYTDFFTPSKSADDPLFSALLHGKKTGGGSLSDVLTF